MRVPVAWMREYCDPPLSTAELVERQWGRGLIGSWNAHWLGPSATLSNST